MKLVVTGKPHNYQAEQPVQTILAKYDPIKQVTTINTDVDIVTLGLAVNVLMDQYERYLGKMQPDIAQQIKEATERVVSFSEQDRNKNTESGISEECRTNVSSNGAIDTARSIHIIYDRFGKTTR